MSKNVLLTCYSRVSKRVESTCINIFGLIGNNKCFRMSQSLVRMRIKMNSCVIFVIIVEAKYLSLSASCKKLFAFLY